MHEVSKCVVLEGSCPGLSHMGVIADQICGRGRRKETYYLFKQGSILVGSHVGGGVPYMGPGDKEGPVVGV